MNRVRRRVKIRAVIAAVLALGLLGLTACNDGGGTGGDSPQASAQPSASVTQASSSPTPEPTSTIYAAATPERAAQNVPVPVMPEEAKLQTDEGWEAFAKYFIEEVNFMVQTNDATGMRAVSADGCYFCRVETTYAQILTDNDQWLMNGTFTLSDIDDKIDSLPDGSTGRLLVVARFDSSIVSESGVLGTAEGNEQGYWYLQLRPSESGWRVVHFETTH